MPSLTQQSESQIGTSLKNTPIISGAWVSAAQGVIHAEEISVHL